MPRGAGVAVETAEGDEGVRVLHTMGKESTLRRPGPPGTWHKNRTKQP